MPTVWSAVIALLIKYSLPALNIIRFYMTNINKH